MRFLSLLDLKNHQTLTPLFILLYFLLHFFIQGQARCSSKIFKFNLFLYLNEIVLLWINPLVSTPLFSYENCDTIALYSLEKEWLWATSLFPMLPASVEKWGHYCNSGCEFDWSLEETHPLRNCIFQSLFKSSTRNNSASSSYTTMSFKVFFLALIYMFIWLVYLKMLSIYR